MKIETTIKVTLTNEELNAVKVVHNMLANLPTCKVAILNNALFVPIDLMGIQEGLTSIYALANNGDISELD